MSRMLKNVEKLTLTALCLVAIFAFFIPAMHVEINFLGASTTSAFSMASFIDQPENPLGAIDLPELQQRDVFDLSDGSSPFALVARRVAAAVGAYIGAALLLVAALICTVLNRLNKASAVLLIIACGLLAYGGNAMLAVPGLMQDALLDLLGFLAMFIDLSNLIGISLGGGFWLGIIAMAAAVAAKVIFLAQAPGSGVKRKDLSC